MTTASRPVDEPWAQFWANNSRGGPAQAGGGCLPGRWAAIEASQKAAWSRFVAKLPRSAGLLDLATGDGRVLKWILSQRRDLKLIGVDRAPQLPDAPRGTTIRTGVAMERLPFPDARFHAVTSQFGFEYGDIEATAREIARVLRPGGKVGLLVHRGDGPILEHNRNRAEAIAWALNEKAIIARVRSALNMASTGPIVACDLATAAAREGAQRFGPDSPAWEIPEAVGRTLAMGGPSGLASLVSTLAAIESQARNEIGRIESLAQACATADDRGRLTAGFAAVGLAIQATDGVTGPTGRPFGDFLTIA